MIYIDKIDNIYIYTLIRYNVLNIYSIQERFKGFRTLEIQMACCQDCNLESNADAVPAACTLCLGAVSGIEIVGILELVVHHLIQIIICYKSNW